MTFPKTVHITNSYHPTSGGISTFYRALMRTATEQGRQIRLIVPGEATRIEQVSDLARIYYLAAKATFIGDARYKLLWAWGPTGSLIKQILRDEEPDLVEFADKYTTPYLAGLLRKGWVKGVSKKPILVATSHERMDDIMRLYMGMPGPAQWFSRLYMRSFYFAMFDWHIANSEYTAEELFPASIGHRLYREIRVLSMGVDCDAFHPRNRTDEARAKLIRRAGVTPGATLLLYVGRLAREKNLDLLVELLGNLPGEYVLVIAGEGEFRSHLEQQIGGRARFLGHLRDREEMAATLAGADIFVHPNPTEPFGIAPLEAMAAGLPVVGPASGGILSYANTENAWLGPAEPKAFASAIRSINHNAQERAQKTSRAREMAERFCWPRVAARFFEFFDEAVTRGFPPRSNVNR